MLEPPPGPAEVNDTPASGGERPAVARRPRRRLARIAAAVVALALLAAVAALLLTPRLERTIHARIEGTLARHGLRARLESVRIGLSPPLHLGSLRIEKPGFGSRDAQPGGRAVGLSSRGLLGRVRIALGSVTLEGPAAFSAQLAPTEWNVEIVPSRTRLRCCASPSGVSSSAGTARVRAAAWKRAPPRRRWAGS